MSFSGGLQNERKIVSKLELGYLIHEGLRHTLKEQEKLLNHERVTDLIPVIRQLAEFALDLEDWYSDKFHLRDRSDHFLAEARKIECEANRKYLAIRAAELGSYLRKDSRSAGL